MKAVIELDVLKRLIKSTSKFISKDEKRPMLQYIQLNIDKENLTIQTAAVDGFKISVEHAKCIDTDESFIVYIKPYLPVGARNEYAIIEVKDGNCYINVGESIVGYRQPTGTYLDIQEIVKSFQSEEAKYKIAFNKNFLLDLITSVEFENKALAKNPLILEFRSPIEPVIFKTKTGLKAILPCRTFE